jgi:hypothetical protein
MGMGMNTRDIREARTMAANLEIKDIENTSHKILTSLANCDMVGICVVGKYSNRPLWPQTGRE